MQELISLDISSKCTGICAFNPETKIVTADAIQRRIKKSSKFLKNIHPKDITDQIISFIELNIDDPMNVSVYIEEYMPGRSMKGQWVISWLQGYIVSRLEYTYNCNVRYIHQRTWKKHLIGHRTYGKEFIYESVMNALKKEKWKLVTSVKNTPDKDFNPYQDILDAFGVGYIFTEETVTN